MSRLHPERVPSYLGHILECIAKIETYVSGLDEEAFGASQMAQDAVIRNFEVIGEASNRIVKNDPTFLERHPEFPFHLAYGMRNTLAHGYDEVIIRTVWIAINTNLSMLKNAVLAYQNEETPDDAT